MEGGAVQSPIHRRMGLQSPPLHGGRASPRRMNSPSPAPITFRHLQQQQQHLSQLQQLHLQHQAAATINLPMKLDNPPCGLYGGGGVVHGGSSSSPPSAGLYGGGGRGPVPASPPPVSSNPENNACRLIDYRGVKVAAFDVDGRELVCLPQAFELFLKHLVGGLHTVYTKLKRLDVTPVVCNVEQVRVLRGLGAIQPGVNRCKLISPKEFDVLYDDCTNSRWVNTILMFAELIIY